LLESSQDLGQVRAFDDLEILRATKQLQSSTATIDKQIEVLKIQQAAVSTLAAAEAQLQQQRSITNAVQHRLWREALEQVNADVS
jgi:hypothetical protein